MPTHRRFVVPFLLLLPVLTPTLFAQEGEGPPKAAVAPAIKTTQFPFELYNGKICVETMVNGQGPFPFVLDTASPPTVLDIDLAKSLDIKVRSTGSVGGAGEGRTPAGMTGEVKLEFGGITIERSSIMAAALNRRLRAFSGREIRGLIGNDWVSQRVVEIDYAKKIVTVHEGPNGSKGWKYEGDGVSIPTRIRGYTYVGGSATPPGHEPFDLTYVIDTGAGLSATMTTQTVNKEHLLDLKTPMYESIVGYGLGGAVTHRVCRFDQIALGDMPIAKPIVTLSQDKGGALGGSIEGLIGYEVLGKFKVIFDGPHKRMILEKGPTYGDAMEADMSGLVLSGDGEGGHLRVMHLVEGAPAEAAGVKLSDVLLKLDGEAVDAEDRDKIRQLFRQDGAERTLELKRGEETVTVKFKLKRAV